jgi:formylmethanofuran dehydrogenase subunit E
MGRDWQMGGNYPPGLTQKELDDHLDPPMICNECKEQFMEDDVEWDEDSQSFLCDGCAGREFDK